jgi:peptidyl-prolyl cis-trans isomerase C
LYVSGAYAICAAYRGGPWDLAVVAAGNTGRKVHMARHTALALIAMAAVIVAPSQLYAQKSAKKPASAAAKKTLVAKVEGKRIYRRDVEAAFRSLPPEIQKRGLESVYENVLEMLIERRMVTVYGRRENFHKDKEVKRRLRVAEDQIIREVYLNRLIKKYLTEDRIRAHYDAYVKKNPPKTEVHARHILVKEEAKAKSLIGEIEAGKDFAEVARANSVGPSASRGGDLGYFSKGEMVKAFSDVAFALKKGEISKTPVKTQFGWHVIKVEEKRTRAAPPYAKIKGQMRREVWAQLGQNFLRQYREQAKVVRYSIDGKTKLPPLPKGFKPTGAAKPAKIKPAEKKK